jgi:hypothetical protein
MTINYNLGIPASGDNPSTDQPNMQVNNDAIAQYVAIDHVAFNTNGSGQHEQVTFNANNIPSIPTNPPVLFTNNQDGSGNVLNSGFNQLFFYSGNALNTSNQYFQGTLGGSMLLFQGMILKWGTTIGAPDNTPINFNSIAGSAFPNNCFSVTATAVNTVTSQNAIVIVGGVGKTSFTPRILTAAGTPIAGTINWIAIGN